MAIVNGIGCKVVRTLATAPNTKNYIKVKEVASTDVKNYTNVSEASGEKKDYINVVKVTYDTPKDYMLVNYVAAP